MAVAPITSELATACAEEALEVSLSLCRNYGLAPMAMAAITCSSSSWFSTTRLDFRGAGCPTHPPTAAFSASLLLCVSASVLLCFSASLLQGFRASVQRPPYCPTTATQTAAAQTTAAQSDGSTNGGGTKRRRHNNGGTTTAATQQRRHKRRRHKRRRHKTTAGMRVGERQRRGPCACSLTSALVAYSCSRDLNRDCSSPARPG